MLFTETLRYDHMNKAVNQAKFPKKENPPVFPGACIWETGGFLLGKVLMELSVWGAGQVKPILRVFLDLPIGRASPISLEIPSSMLSDCRKERGIVTMFRDVECCPRFQHVFRHPLAFINRKADNNHIRDWLNGFLLSLTLHLVSGIW